METTSRSGLPRGVLPRVIAVIALLMVVGGGFQMVESWASLRGLGAANADAATARFGTGLGGGLVAVFGALTLHALFDGARWRPVFLWVGVEKLLYAGAFALAATLGVVDRSGWFVVAYDAVAAGLVLTYYARLSGPSEPPR